MSAASNLAGMFPPKGNQIWNKDIPWQPIPIHTTPMNQDALIYLGKPCPKHDKIVQELKNQEEYKQFVQYLQPTINYIEKHIKEKCNTIEELIFIHDALFVESFYGLELPRWTETFYPNYTMPLLALFFKLPAYTPQLARLNAGMYAVYPQMDDLTREMIILILLKNRLVICGFKP